MNHYQLHFTFHHGQLLALMLEYKAEDERIALAEAMLDLSSKAKYQKYREKQIKTITVYLVK